MRSLRPLTSLLIATALLLAGHGLHLTLLPLRADQIGFSDTLIGLTASAYYLGFVTGCFFIPNIIAQVGHIRIFGALLAGFLSALLALDLSNHLAVWLILRFTIGAMMCGAYTVIESWLTDQTPSDARGKVLAIYTFLTLAAITLGQFLVNLTPADSSKPFILAGILIALAVVPVSLTKSLAPAPVPSTKLSFTLLYKRSHTAFAGGLLSGIVMGSFWSLAAVFSLRAAGTTDFVPLFISSTVVGGALAQYPIGLISDRIDRRYVLAGLAIATAGSSLLMTLSTNTSWLLCAGFLFGAAANAIYAVSLAKAADNSKPDEFVTIASSVLLLNSLAAATAPLAIGQMMSLFGSSFLFFGIAGFSVIAALYIMLQPLGKTAVSVQDQSPFVAAGLDTAPASFDNDPRSPEASEADLQPLPERPSYSEFEAEFDYDEVFTEEEE